MPTKIPTIRSVFRPPSDEASQWSLDELLGLLSDIEATAKPFEPDNPDNLFWKVLIGPNQHAAICEALIAHGFETNSAHLGAPDIGGAK